MAEKKLSVKQMAWAEHAAKGISDAEAARLAGYAKKNARQQGAANRAKPRVMAYYNKLLEKLQSERIADAAEVQEYLTKVLRGQESEQVVVVEGCGDGCSSATTVEKDLQHRDRLKAAELLGKIHGIFTDKVQISEAPTIIRDFE